MKFSHSSPWLLAAIFFAALLIVASPAARCLISGTDGGKSVTTDTAAGMEWLDASNTLGMVVSTALSANPGFQLATESQIETLLEDAGYPAGQLPNGSTSDSTSGNLLASTLGYTFDYWVQFYGPGASGWEYLSYAWYLDSANGRRPVDDRCPQPASRRGWNVRHVSGSWRFVRLRQLEQFRDVG